VPEILGLELADLGAEALVPQRRLGELAKYGMRADASVLRRHPDGRRLATLPATVRHLEGKSVDDTLELLDLLMATELVNKTQSASNKEKVRKHPSSPRPPRGRRMPPIPTTGGPNCSAGTPRCRGP
jgi:hypothetical protein